MFQKPFAKFYLLSSERTAKFPGTVDRKVLVVNTVYNEKLRHVALFVARCCVLTDSECFSCFMSAIDHRVCCQIKENVPTLQKVSHVEHHCVNKVFEQRKA